MQTDLAVVQHVHIERVVVLDLDVVHDIDVELALVLVQDIDKLALVLVQDIHKLALVLVAATASAVDLTVTSADIPALLHHNYYLHLDILA